MCTSVAMKSDGLYFGRNMDIDYSFGESVILTPRNFPLPFRKADLSEKHYAIMGMGTAIENYPLYADGMNENGLCMAALKFPDNARYSEMEITGKANITPFELILWVLGKCRNICEAKALLSETSIIAIPFSEKLPLSPLHWHIADNSGSITVEFTSEGMKIYDNPVGVLTNNPPFPFHLENLSQFSGLTPDFTPSDDSIKPFGLGFGALGLPGDFSPASRFVKAAFLLRNSALESNPVTQLFHILDSAAIPCGAVITPDRKFHYTSYSSGMDTAEMTYYYKTYSNNQLTAVKMNSDNMNGSELTCFPLKKEQQILYCNG